MSENKKHGQDPEKANPETLASIIQSAEEILKHAGVKKYDPLGQDMFGATVPIAKPSLVDAKAGTLPSVSITKPKGEFARRARWGYEITYGMQDDSLSRHVLILNGEIPEAEISSYGRPLVRQQLTEEQATLIANDLSALA